MEANLTLEYDDEETAHAIAEAVSPDNQKAPKGLTVKTTQQATKVTTEIRLDGKLATFIATIDDLLCAVSTAEKTLHVVKKK